jgi:hypothetical protein
MAEGTHPRFETLRPAINARWKDLLRGKVAPSQAPTGLVTPEMLIFMVDDTLNRLGSNLNSTVKPDRRSASLAPFGPTRVTCRCGLQLLLTYYLAGATALRELLPAQLGADRVKVLHEFNRIAHDEMEALCGICQHRGGPMCSLRSERRSESGVPEK